MIILQNIKKYLTQYMANTKNVENMANMKAIFCKKSLNLLFVVLLLPFSLNIHAGWIDDWAAQSTHSGVNYFEGQKRGYFTGGSYSARFRNSQENLFSIQKPRLKSGCGGIDLFMGGFSFMDPEYLMQKLQRALQAAPAIAFDLALKEMCQECASTLGKFEGFINKLNSTQISECAIAQDIATLKTSDDGFGQMLSLFDSNKSAENSSDKMFYESKQTQKANNNQPTQEQKQSVEGCSQEFKDVFTKNGSVLDHIADKKGLKQYASFMRAYLGDVIIGYQDKQYNNKTVDACPDVDVVNIDKIIEGKATIRPITGDCTNSGDEAMSLIIEKKLNDISSNIKSNSQLNVSNINFLNSAPLNVVTPLSHATKNNNEAFYINNFKDIIAREMAYAMVDDLIGKVNELVQVAQSQVKSANSGANNKTCEIGIVMPIIDSIKDMSKKAVEMKASIQDAKMKYVENTLNKLNYNKEISKQ